MTASENAVNRILKFIKAMDSPCGQALEREIAGMDADQQLDRVTQPLAAIGPTEPKLPEGPGRSAEDTVVIERFEAAVKRMQS